jgi:hypothetical protein
MKRKVVAMALIPGGIRRAPPMRSDLGYAKYSRATWDWWCRLHDADFVVIDKPASDSAYAKMPPTMQRWAVLDRLIAERGEDAQAVLIDADTMIRWDTPDIFELGRGFSAVADASSPSWVLKSTKAFQHLFPGTTLHWWDYFNSGVIVLGAAQRAFIRAFLDHAVRSWPELDAAMTSGNVGTEQTPLNFMVKRENEPVHFLPRPFNFVNCFPLHEDLVKLEQGALIQTEQSARPDPALFAVKAFGRPSTFDFVELAYVWHFTNVVTLRSPVMGETWRRVQDNYPGAVVRDA